MIHIDDLPLPLDHCWFPKRTRQYMYGWRTTKIRECFEEPEKNSLPFIKELSELESKALMFMPDRKEHFKFTDDEIFNADKGDSRVSYEIFGGEYYAISKLHHIFVDR